MSREIQPVHSEGDQPWYFFGRNDAKAETPVFWPPHVKSWLIGKDSDTGRDWGQEAKGTTEDEMAGWHHWLDGHEFEQASGVGDGQESLACCSPRGHKELDMTERLNWTESEVTATLLCALLFCVVLWKRAWILEADSLGLQSLLCSTIIHLFRRYSLHASHVVVPWQVLGVSREQEAGAAGSVNELLKQ